MDPPLLTHHTATRPAGVTSSGWLTEAHFSSIGEAERDQEGLGMTVALLEVVSDVTRVQEGTNLRASGN